MFKKSVKIVAVNPIGSQRLQFRRTTARYNQKGSFSSNRGYLSVARDVSNGQFVARKHLA